MDKNKIALINPPKRIKHYSVLLPNLGLSYIASYLKSKNISFDFMDLDIYIEWKYRNRFSGARLFKCLYDKERLISFIFGDDDREIVEIFSGFISTYNLDRYDIACISASSHNTLISSLCLSKLLKERGVTVIIGGAFFGTWIKDLYEIIASGLADYIVTGDGGQPLAELISHINSGTSLRPEIHSAVISRSNRQAVPFKALPAEIDPPYFDTNSLALYTKLNRMLVLPYFTGKGCLNDCSFCSTLYHKTPQPFHPDKIASDLNHLKKTYNCNYFYLCTSNLFASTTQRKELLEELKPLGIQWGSHISVNCLDESITEDLYASGCRWIVTGIETADQNAANRMKKSIEISRIPGLLQKIHSAGIKTITTIMEGFPGESAEEFKSALNFIRSNSSSMNIFSITKFMLLKATYIYANPAEFGINIIEDNSKYKDIISRSCSYSDPAISAEIKLKRAKILQNTATLQYALFSALKLSNYNFKNLLLLTDIIKQRSRRVYFPKMFDKP